MTTSTQPIREINSAVLSIPDQNVAGVFPLSFAQESLWIEEQITSSSAYNMPEGWIVRGRLDLGALQRALNGLVKRHETLRTVFRTENGRPVQVVLQEGAFALKVARVRGREELDGLVREECEKRFDLANGPLARGLVCRMSEEEHFLMVNTHHLVCDAWSQGVFIRDLAEEFEKRESFEGSERGEGFEKGGVGIQFADYAVWQRECFAGEVLSQQVEWWKGVLADAAKPVSPIADFSTGNGAGGPAAKTRFYFLNGDLVSRLEGLSREKHATLFATLASAFCVLLHKATGEEDVIIGCPMAGRDRVETEGLIGLFVNTHALRVSLAGDPTFESVLQQVKERAIEALSHQNAPLNRVVDAVRAERGGRHPLFRTVFGLQTGPIEEIRMGDVSLQRVELDNGAAKFDWTVLATRTGKGISIRSEHRSGLYADQTIERLMGAFEALLEEVLKGAWRRISELDVASARERQLILGEWNRTAKDYGRDGTVHECLAGKAKWHPDRVALIAGDRSFTYGEVEDCANRVAASLQRAGVKRGDRVVLNFERSPELVIAMLATLKVGGVYVPMDRQYPPERQELIFRESGAVLELADTADGGGHERGARRLYFEAAAKGDASGLERVTLAGDEAAYVIFTSGSTGTPKGVVVPHRAILRLVQGPNYVEIRGEDVFLQFAPAAFDASTFEIWGALLNGARLVIAPKERLSLAALGRIIQEKKVSVLWLTAGLFDQMVEHELGSLAGVKQLLTGGEALSPKHVRKALEGLPRTTIINGYGPTENTTFSCCHRIPRDGQERGSIPIGKPISNSRAYVLDGARRLCAVGMPGELYVAGDGLALGYLGQPELTGEKFVMVRVSANEPAERMYRTGDLARWLRDGTIEFLGRMDSQVKIRGFRIEPGEIEAVLMGCPGVERAVVTVREGKAGKQLVAYVVRKESEKEVEGLREYVGSKLPGYMVPSAFVVLKELPLTANGKVDRRALPEPDFDTSLAGERLAPATEAEKRVAAVWEEVLGRNGFDVRQDFFQLGGHSLLAAQVASRLSQVFETDVPVVALFEHPTIQSLAAAIPEGRTGTSRITRHLAANEARDLLSRLDALPEEEVERLLKEFEDSVN